MPNIAHLDTQPVFNNAHLDKEYVSNTSNLDKQPSGMNILQQNTQNTDP